MIPQFLNKHEPFQLIYRAALQHKDLLGYIPCYC
ncbi:hypothetical protein KHA94_12045 [Bacillus sp. FJAT-49705]|uniref:Transposase n=1 Tax=Cytobacillus citreus TaxID=2833586 RepID=A0ABS5NSW1_9BACI|nr:hypothetical protein [Cytobacillus citreus]